MMGAETSKAKIEPLAGLKVVDKIIVVRKKEGPKIDKVEYLILPKICKISIFHIVITPLITLWFTLKMKPNLLIGYHIIPYAFFVSFVGLITRTPYIVGQTGLKIEEKIKRNIFLGILVKIVFLNAKKINCPGRSSVKFWSDRFPSIKSKFHVLHSTVDTNFFKPKSNKREYKFTYLGRLSSIKNVDYIIKSIHTLNVKSSNKYRIQVVGDGPEYEALKRLTNDLGANDYIHFKGFVNNPELYLNNSEFLIMCSTSEGLPTAMMQGMACKTIPVTNLVGNIGDIVTDKSTGFVFESLNINDMASTLLKCVETVPKKLDVIKNNCRKIIITNHSHNSAKLKWEELFNQTGLINL